MPSVCPCPCSCSGCRAGSVCVCGCVDRPSGRRRSPTCLLASCWASAAAAPTTTSRAATPRPAGEERQRAGAAAAAGGGARRRYRPGPGCGRRAGRVRAAADARGVCQGHPELWAHGGEWGVVGWVRWVRILHPRTAVPPARSQGSAPCSRRRRPHLRRRLPLHSIVAGGVRVGARHALPGHLCHDRRDGGQHRARYGAPRRNLQVWLLGSRAGACVRRAGPALPSHAMQRQRRRRAGRGVAQSILHPPSSERCRSVDGAGRGG